MAPFKLKTSQEIRTDEEQERLTMRPPLMSSPAKGSSSPILSAAYSPSRPRTLISELALDDG